MKSDEVYLGHILDEIDFLLRQSEGVSFGQFMKDEVLKRACARSFEIIGEAVKNLSSDFRRRHKHVEWKNIAGFRDRLIHNYFDVNWNVLWSIVKGKIPELKLQMMLRLFASSGTGTICTAIPSNPSRVGHKYPDSRALSLPVE